MAGALKQLIDGNPTQAQIDAFIASHEFPLVEGTRVTFVYNGEADALYLRHWIFGLSANAEFQRVEGTTLWHLSVELPEASRVEYKLEIHRDGHHRWIRDPLNPNLAHDPFGANSVCHALNYQRPDWTIDDPDARKGYIEEHVLMRTAFGDGRRVSVYVPARFRESRQYRALIVHDGGDYAHFASMITVLDNLIHRQEVAPLIVALLHPKERLIEYADDEAHARFVVDEVLPFMRKTFPIDPSPDGVALMGASFGAVASLSVARRYPGVFGSLLLQSGSFAFTDIGDHKKGPAFDRVVEMVNQFRDDPGRPVDRVFLSCGVYESLIYENRSMVPLLQQTGMEVRYEESRDGHNWENWRDRMRTGLSWLFPGPLWFVYE